MQEEKSRIKESLLEYTISSDAVFEAIEMCCSIIEGELKVRKVDLKNTASDLEEQIENIANLLDEINEDLRSTLDEFKELTPEQKERALNYHNEQIKFQPRIEVLRVLIESVHDSIQPFAGRMEEISKNQDLDNETGINLYYKAE